MKTRGSRFHLPFTGGSALRVDVADTTHLEVLVKVAELMRTPVLTVSPDDTVADAIATLADGHVSAVPVVDARGRLLGVLSTTDILAATAESDPARRAEVLDETPVRMLMTRRTLTIAPDAEVREAAQQLLYADVHRLFVVDQGRLTGVVSSTDVVRAIATGGLAQQSGR
jgi:CBS domain-containing protein